jgi:hypothetical protein
MSNQHIRDLAGESTVAVCSSIRKIIMDKYIVYRCDGKNESHENHVNKLPGNCSCGRPTTVYEPSKEELLSYTASCQSCLLSTPMKDCTKCLFEVGRNRERVVWYISEVKVAPEYTIMEVTT